MRPLKDALPPAGDKVLYVFYDFETSQNTEYATRLSYTYSISSACSSFVLDARTPKTRAIACDVVQTGYRSGKIQWGTAFIPNGTALLGQ